VVTSGEGKLTGDVHGAYASLPSLVSEHEKAAVGSADENENERNCSLVGSLGAASRFTIGASVSKTVCVSNVPGASS
jgi:hypothetical protein